MFEHGLMSTDTIEEGRGMDARNERDESQFVRGQLWGNRKDKVEVVRFWAIQLVLGDCWLGSIVVHEGHESVLSNLSGAPGMIVISVLVVALPKLVEDGIQKVHPAPHLVNQGKHQRVREEKRLLPKTTERDDKSSTWRVRGRVTGHQVCHGIPGTWKMVSSLIMLSASMSLWLL